MDYMNFAFTVESAWGRCLASFLRSLKSTTTRMSYEGVLQQFFSRVQKIPDKVSREDVENFMYSKTDKHWCKSDDGSVSTATMNKRLSALSSFYKYASSFTITTDTDAYPEALFQRSSPALGIARNKPERAYQVLSYDEMQRFFACIPDTPIGIRDRAIFLFYFWSGRRRAEVQRLRWKDIQASSAVSSGFVYSWRGKGKQHEQRSAELPKAAVVALMHYLESSGRIGTIQPDSPLFVAIGRDEQGGNVRPGEIRPLSEKGIVNRLKHYGREAGIDFSLHVFRHTAAYERHQAGMDIVAIRDFLDHASLDQTYHYVHTLSAQSDPGAQLLEERFNRLSHLSSSSLD